MRFCCRGTILLVEGKLVWTSNECFSFLIYSLPCFFFALLEQAGFMILYLATCLFLRTLFALSCKCSCFGAYFCSASFDATVKLWDVEQGRLICSLNGHRYAICIAFVIFYIRETVNPWLTTWYHLLHTWWWNKPLFWVELDLLQQNLITNFDC